MSWIVDGKRRVGLLVSRAGPIWARWRPDIWTGGQWLARSQQYWRTGWRDDPRGAVNHPEAYWAGGDGHASYTPDLLHFLASAGDPPGSVLEIGCNAGRNLFHLAQSYPGIRLAGIDINPEAIAFAKAHVLGAAALDLRVGDLSAPQTLRAFPDDLVDVVLSMAVLVHLPPGEVKARILRECLRIARRGVLLIEPHRAGSVTWNTVPNRRMSPFSIDDYTRYVSVPPTLPQPTHRGEGDPYRLLYFSAA